MAEIRAEHAEGLLAQVFAHAKNAGIPVEAMIKTGDAASVVAEVAKALDCDGIVMGTQGHGAIGSRLLGSVAARVVHLAEVPVTLVK